LPDDPQLADILPRLLAQRLFQALLYEEEASAQEIHRLTHAYRAAGALALAREKFSAARAAAGQYVQRKDNDDFLNLVNQYLTAAKEYTKAHRAHLNKLNEPGGSAP